VASLLVVTAMRDRLFPHGRLESSPLFLCFPPPNDDDDEGCRGSTRSSPSSAPGSNYPTKWEGRKKARFHRCRFTTTTTTRKRKKEHCSAGSIDGDSCGPDAGQERASSQEPSTLRSRSCGGDRLRTAVGDESAMHRLSFGYSPPWWLGQTKGGKGFFETLVSFHLKMLLRVLFHEFLVVERK
jgi:hypothetical protein